MKYPTFLGIDLTATAAKPSACLGLDDKSQLVYLGFLTNNGEIVTLVNFCSPQLVAIDAPLSLPAGYAALRKAVPASQNTQESTGNVIKN